MKVFNDDMVDSLTERVHTHEQKLWRTEPEMGSQVEVIGFSERGLNPFDASFSHRCGEAEQMKVLFQRWQDFSPTLKSNTYPTPFPILEI